MTNKSFESISALLDDEVNSKELDNTLEQMSQEPEQLDAFSRYSLIGDVLRQEQELITDSSFADKIQQAIAATEQEQVAEQVTEPEVVSIASHPSWGQRIAARVQGFTQSSTGRGMSQFAIAASVALVAVVGVGNMSGTEELKDDVPAVIASPLIGGVTPVSISSERPEDRKTANQKTQSRINALISDHQQQLRVADDKKEQEQTEEEKIVD